jgi:hypothetical protein
VRDRDEIESVIATFAREPNGGLLVPPDAITCPRAIWINSREMPRTEGHIV